MILSIGMIVKNEEKYLDECLTALHPILTKLDSELIIVDTGSTDNTVEIAKKHTDKVFHFEWCNDFAAARNVTLDHAKGEWYMFLDADEILEDSAELISFFKSKEYKKYKSASYNILNYRNKEKTSSTSILIPRMRKLSKNLRFIGIVHEYMPAVHPIKNLTKTTFNHHGYVFTTRKQAKAKHKRNIDLLLTQLNTTKDNPRLRNQLGESYLLYYSKKNMEEALHHYKAGKELAIEENNNNMYCVIAINLISLYTKMNMNLEALNEAELYFKSKSDSLESDTDVYYLMIFAFNALNQYESCAESYVKYVDNLNKYKNNKYSTREIYYRSISFTDNYSLYNATLHAINSYIKLEKYEDAKQLINKNLAFSCEFKENQDFLFKCYLELMSAKNNYHDLVSLYNIEITRNEEFESNLKKAIEAFINENIEEKYRISDLFSEFNNDSKDPYLDFMKIRKTHFDNTTDIDAMIDEFLDSIDKFDVYYSDIIYYILKNNISLKVLKYKLNSDDLLTCFDIINKQHDDFTDIILKYDYEADNPYESYILKTLYESALVLIENEDKEVIASLFMKYINNFKIYIEYTYNENIFTENNLSLLPRRIQFGYYCIKANECLSKNDELNYIRFLRKALASDKSMKSFISLLTESYKEENKNNTPNELSEFDMLAITVKNNINELIKTNNLIEAEIILNEYKKLNSNDPEIKSLERMITR